MACGHGIRLAAGGYDARPMLACMLKQGAGPPCLQVVTVLYYATVTSEKSSHKEGLSHAGDILFRPMGGFEAGAAALLVAVKQLIPDNEVALLGGALRFRAKVRGLPRATMPALLPCCPALPPGAAERQCSCGSSAAALQCAPAV